MPESIFHAGHLALDLVNTERMSDGTKVDLLESPSALLKWLRWSGAVSAAEVSMWDKRFLRNRTAAETLLQQARGLRSAVRQMAEAIVSRRATSERTVVTINSVLADSPRVPALVRGSKGYALEWRSRAKNEAALLAPVAEAAARLLTEGDHSRVRKCANPACILYFYDMTRSRTRNWCSMQGCGNRAKAARFYDRHLASAAEGDTGKDRPRSYRLVHSRRVRAQIE